MSAPGRIKSVDDCARHVVWDDRFKEAISKYRAGEWNLPSVRSLIFRVAREKIEELEKWQKQSNPTPVAQGQDET